MHIDALILLFLIVLTPLLSGAVCLLWGWTRLRKRVGKLPISGTTWLEKKWIIVPSAACLGLYILCYLWGRLIEPTWVEVTHTEIKVKEPVLGHKRFRIIHLSDLHIEGTTSREFAMIRAILEEQPHIILMTGDYLNEQQHASTFQNLLDALSDPLVAPYGVYAVPGHWDRKFEIRHFFQETAARQPAEARKPLLLEDDYTLIKEGKSKLLIVGLEVQPHTGLRDLLRGASPEAFRIFLHHKPDAVDEIHLLSPGERLDLFLCGHTHGGQVRLPFWGAVVTLSKFHKKFEMGHYTIGDTHMYVNRGMGMEGGLAPRIRFNCRPEVAVIDLVADSSE
jgi:predicted MPP superfamily phosphohydrolase